MQTTKTRHAYAIDKSGTTAFKFESAALRDFFLASVGDGYDKATCGQFRAVLARDPYFGGPLATRGYNALDMSILEYWDGSWSAILDAAHEAGLTVC